MRRATLICAAAALALAAPAGARAAGGPVPPLQGGAGVSVPGGPDSFIAVSGGLDTTVVMRIRRDGVAVERTRRLSGAYGVPGVTFDGITTGLSADGTTLVLASPINQYPARATTFRVLAASSLRPLLHFTLKGMVTVDAISPDGRWLYLVDYKGGNVASYDVRAYDLRAHKLLAKPVVDPREPDEKLNGTPVTRVSSGDGRWQYTLYTGEEPFIHALDTVGRTAVCIDLPKSLAQDLGNTKLSLGPNALTLSNDGAAVRRIDLKTFKPIAPKPAARPRPTPAAAAPKGDGGPSLALWLIALAAVAVLVAATRATRRRVRQA